MRAKALLVLLGATALGAYHVGRHSSPAPVAAVALPLAPGAKPLAFTAAVSPPIATTATPGATNNSAPTLKIQTEKVAPPTSPRSLHRLRSSARLRSH
jgi:uncharacterized membrane protein